MFKIAIVGAGPAGSSAALRLLKSKGVKFQVNLFDRSLTPWGLLRTGVAPDHPEVKNTTQAWQSISTYNSFQFYGGVNIGQDSGILENLTLGDLTDTHDAVILANGAYKSRELNIPGRNNPRVLNGQQVVAYFNSDPIFYPKRKMLQDGRRLGIVGCGNVALDIARVILQPDLLRQTDVNSEFLQKITNISEISFFIRRGPFNLPCTTRELRELLNLPRVKNINISGLDLPLRSLEEFEKLQKSRKISDRKQKRLLKLLSERENVEQNLGENIINFHFFTTPIEISNSKNELNVTFREKSGNLKIYEMDWLVESLGYDLSPISDQIGNINLETGRAKFKDKNIYLAGWALSGATGVVGDSTDSARRVTESILSDIESGLICPGERTSLSPIAGINRLSWSQWDKIDAEEIARGTHLKKSREKLLTFAEMLKFSN